MNNMKCPKCNTSMLKNGFVEDEYWCLACGLEGKPRNLANKAKEIKANIIKFKGNQNELSRYKNVGKSLGISKLDSTDEHRQKCHNI